MAEVEVTVGIDVGTTSVKAVAADADGHVMARARIPHRLVAPTPDRFEHDPAEAWSRGVAGAWQQVSTGRRVAGVGVAAMVPSLCGVDASGRPLTPGLLYGDARGAPGGEVAGADGGASTGAERGTDGGEVAGFARWLVAEAEPAGLWPAQALATHTLCGVAAVDGVTAMALGPLAAGGAWDPGACTAAGIDPAQLPLLAAGGGPVGEVHGTPVAAGTVDVYAEQLVAGAGAPGDVLVLCGTTLIPWVLTDRWVEVDGLWTVPYTAAGLVAVGGASNAGGLFVDAVRALLGAGPAAGGPAAGGSAAGDPAAGGPAAGGPAAGGPAGHGPAPDPERVPVWLPYLRGERTPLHDRSRRAELLDLELGHGPAEVLRAAHEATGFVVRHHIERSGVAATRLVAAGGGTRSAAWVQALADATGLPVDVAAVAEGAALGAAYLARVAAGLEPDTTGAGRWARTAGRVEPRPAWVEACRRRYARFLEGSCR